MNLKIFTWSSQVRAYEVDAQGIVNNAQYLSYFDNARTLQLMACGINWVELSHKGFNLILARAEIQFIKSLKAFQSFHIVSEVEQRGKLRLIFHQTLFVDNDTPACKGINTVVCVDNQRNKPVAIDTIFSVASQ
ncbi:acyl-CoA thioesterase [Legionella israelensis]|uniref:Acyl-CoA thioesterase n=1 Tax=Legionella israelensis TaxID=454 RepID=A0AAX1EEC7_9GAMM|nr:acyl-CoA thioesterase [Legionella israelensis]QBR83456.1 acyl-CoA thioesterase [Legionella israelensis]